MILRLATKIEQNMLHQRAKLVWMKGGDQCSRIFFRKVAKRRSSKRVFQITDSGGHVLTEQQDVINEFIAYYQTLLGGECRHRVIDLCYLRPWARYIISEAEALILVQPITLNEIKLAVFDIDEVKAPGPDGYSSGFFKAAWPIIGEEVTRAIMEFFRTGRLLKHVNSTLISLIPKRMRGVLDKLISPSQNAFVPGRSIGDNILLAQELFHGYNQQQLPPRCALKVDLRKAYDIVEWDFLIAVLTLFGFPAQFILWIEECVTTPSFSVLTLILHQFIDQDGGFSYHWRCGEVNLFQLGFADDLLLFSRADTSSIHIFKWGLMEFADLSGFHVNPQKSHLILSLSASTHRDTLLPIWDFRKVIVPSGRVQLIKSVLSALQVYWAMAFILPKTVKGRLRSAFDLFFGSVALVWAMLRFLGNSWHWPPITDMESIDITHFLPTIHGGQDRVLWAGPEDSFSSAAAYDVFHPPDPK
ncbi:UNVERIFIED_CONTAM: hypothetical protein Slati_1447300 [Sesamum latifolium]|uniref:Reverse transcriptase domain-containing protein n=1 Tax=Sesamum latifolium TaxID=2727402 RepID=A0AAW2X467_9LAMI